MTQKTSVKTQTYNVQPKYFLSDESIAFNPTAGITFSFRKSITGNCDSYESLLQELEISESFVNYGEILLLKNSTDVPYAAVVLLSDESTLDAQVEMLNCAGSSYGFIDFNKYLMSSIGMPGLKSPAYISVGMDNKGVILLMLKEETEAAEDVMLSVLEMFEFPEKQNQQNFIEGLD